MLRIRYVYEMDEAFVKKRYISWRGQIGGIEPANLFWIDRWQEACRSCEARAAHAVNFFQRDGFFLGTVPSIQKKKAGSQGLATQWYDDRTTGHTCRKPCKSLAVDAGDPV